MKVLVLGANGKTGKLVVKQAIAAAHEVSVLVRRAGSSCWFVLSCRRTGYYR